MKTEVIRPRGRTFFKLADSVVQTILDENYNNSFWIECDEKGNVIDHDKDGVIATRTLLCKIPKGKDNINLSTLDENCLNLN